MKRLLLATIASFATVVFAPAQTSSSGPAQQPPAFTMITYLKVPPEKAQAYEKLIKTDFGKYMQARADMGDILTWTHTKLVLPSGSDSKYNYVHGIVYKSIPALDPDPETMDKYWSKAGGSRSAFTDSTRSIGSVIVKREMWRLLELVGGVQPGGFLRIDYKKVGMNDTKDYVTNERNVYKKIWDQRIKDGAMLGWAFFGVQFPAGEDRPTNYVTVQAFKDEQQMLGTSAVSYQDSFQKLFPGKQLTDVVKNPAPGSHTTTMEIGRVLDVVRSSGASASGIGR